MKKFLFILIILFFVSCNKPIDGGGDGNEKAILTIKISNNCNGLTECIDIYLDDEKVKEDLKPGEIFTKEVEIGNHKIYASGVCDIFNEWEEKIIYVPPEGYEETLSCISNEEGILTVECSSNCKDIVKNVDFYLDDKLKSELVPGAEWKASLGVGNYKIYGISEKNDEWGPFVIYLPTEGYKETFECDNTKKAFLTIGVSEVCSCNFIYGITIYYTDPTSNEPIIAGNINPGDELTFKATVGYHRITANAKCYQDNLTYYYGPEEIYLPTSNYSFTIPCNEFKP